VPASAPPVKITSSMRAGLMEAISFSAGLRKTYRRAAVSFRRNQTARALLPSMV